MINLVYKANIKKNSFIHIIPGMYCKWNFICIGMYYFMNDSA